mmetsp:Transcript_44446/g.105313  ORF Transcript_44446/g.105313 Transcript_44446/m.105313 type:complete len:547 (-) Transcript_44446:203-1843(-)
MTSSFPLSSQEAKRLSDKKWHLASTNESPVVRAGSIALLGRERRLVPGKSKSPARNDKRGRAPAASPARTQNQAVSTWLHATVASNAHAQPEVLRVKVTTEYNAHVKVKLKSAELEGRGLPATCTPGSTATAMFLGHRIGVLHGTVHVEDFDPMPFGVGGLASYVGKTGRWKYTYLHAMPPDASAEANEKAGKALDVSFISAAPAEMVPTLEIHIRTATDREAKRATQLDALKEAEVKGDYDFLLAQVTKARAAGVESEHIERGSELLKQLRKQGLHVGDGCDKDTLKKYMQWSLVTRKSGDHRSEERCSTTSCPCNEQSNDGEVLEFSEGLVQECLKEHGYGDNADEQLFNGIVEAAVAAPDGVVWKAGGKLIFSAMDRNQSVTALLRLLGNSGSQRCADMIHQLVKLSESRYGGYVTAVQVNFHPHGDTFHDQHRDIYSAKQRAGPSCTCSFRECVGTVCYTIGSTRPVLLETCTDNLSDIKACGEACQGRKERRWLQSGEAMYFNDVWNRSHTHGIPRVEEPCGPRISIAFLLGAKESDVNHK